MNLYEFIGQQFVTAFVSTFEAVLQSSILSLLTYFTYYYHILSFIITYSLLSYIYHIYHYSSGTHASFQ